MIIAGRLTLLWYGGQVVERLAALEMSDQLDPLLLQSSGLRVQIGAYATRVTELERQLDRARSDSSGGSLSLARALSRSLPPFLARSLCLFVQCEC